MIDRIPLIFIFEYYFLGGSRRQLAPPPGHLASASPKGIVYKHEDLGKPINYYNNLKCQVAPDQVTPANPPTTAPAFAQDPQPTQSQVHLNPVQFPFIKIETLSNNFHMGSEEKQFLGFMFQQNYDQWISEHREAKDYEKDYAQNVIIHELMWRIKSIDTEMGDFINPEIQEAPWPEDQNQKINQSMNSALSNFY